MIPGTRPASSAMHILKNIKEYFRHSTIHGLYYIAEEDRHWTERVFWTTAVSLSLWCTIIVTLSSYREFREHSVSFVVETTYLHWNTTFPAFTVCEKEEEEYIWDHFEKNYPEDTDFNLVRVLKEIIYYRGTCHSCEECKKGLDCSTIFEKNFEIPAPCDKVFAFCKWNDQPFNCCANFLPLISETGSCYTVNSIHTRQDSKQIKMISSRETGPGTLTVGVKRNVWVFMHSSSDVFISIHESNKRWSVLGYGETWTVLFNVVEIVNDPLLQQVPIKRRGCRFPEEIPDHYKLFKYYSYSTCVLECRAIKMLEHCNCINHIIHPAVSGNFTPCNIDGLLCLNNIYSDLVKLKGKHSESEMESGMTCDCSADCNEPDQFILHEEKKLTKKYSEIKFVMETLPNERLRRNVVRSKLDLVVSLGGIAGLFLGASLISIVEILIHFFIRIWTTHPQTNDSNATKDILRQSKKDVQKQLSHVQNTNTEFGTTLPYYEKDYGVAAIFS
ncbi:sodium channel protein Nach [Cryptotermes secundus]|uniref:sodium channel protein Nach n=1 Tax=Cryptotermes secundus TaxID=105785 RepID=UPI001454DA6A|nr:sodium channel protein Nach [Cryptotermes secundus]